MPHCNLLQEESGDTITILFVGSVKLKSGDGVMQCNSYEDPRPIAGDTQGRRGGGLNWKTIWHMWFPGSDASMFAFERENL
jgi:hypothetical protein